MPWQPPDQQVDILLRSTLERAKEEVLSSFAFQRRVIERDQAARGVFGGAVAHRARDAARDGIRQFGARVVPELLTIHREVADGTPPPDAIQWIRETVAGLIDALVSGLGAQIDGFKTTGGAKGMTEHLRPVGHEVKRDMEIELGRLEIRSRLVNPSLAPASGAAAEYDVFICHASEDKPDVAEPLAAALQRRGLRVWIDTFEIRIGDRILARIDDGLRRSRFGVVIISPAFFEKRWSQMELNALAALEASEGRTKILPVWHQMTLGQVQERSPLIAAVRAANTADGIEAITDEIAGVLRKNPEQPIR